MQEGRWRVPRLTPSYGFQKCKHRQLSQSNSATAVRCGVSVWITPSGTFSSLACGEALPLENEWLFGHAWGLSLGLILGILWIIGCWRNIRNCKARPTNSKSRCQNVQNLTSNFVRKASESYQQWNSSGNHAVDPLASFRLQVHYSSFYRPRLPQEHKLR